MATFSYKAVNTSGTTSTGVVEAGDRRQAAKSLAAQGLRVLSLGTASGRAIPAKAADVKLYTEAKAAKKGDGPVSSSKSAKAAAGLAFLKRMLELVNSGLPPGDAVKLLSIRITDPVLKSLATDLWKDLSEGRPLSACVAKRTEWFGDSAANLIEAGEATGQLGPILERIVAHQEESNEMKAKIKASLAYPVFIIFVAFAVVCFFLFFLLPKLRDMLEKLGGQIHWTARFLLWSADFAMTFGPFIIIALVIAGTSLYRWRQTPEGRQATDIWMLKLPLLGRIFLFTEVFQTATLLSTLLASGINTTEALRLVERSLKNTLLRAKFANSRSMIQEGASMSAAFSKTRFLSDISNDMLSVGENTGNIVRSFREIAKIHQRELGILLQRLITIVSAGALGFAFALVAMIALSVVLAIMSVQSGITGK